MSRKKSCNSTRDRDSSVLEPSKTAPPTSETCRTFTSKADMNAPSIPAPSIEWRQIGDTIQHDKEAYSLTESDEQHIYISHDGTRVAMAYPRVNSNCPASVKILEFDGSKWDEKKNFCGECKDGFGDNFAMSGDGKTLAIPYWGRKNDYVEVHQYTEGDGWKSNRLESVESFGKSIALSEDGSRIAIGAPETRGRRGIVQVLYNREIILKDILQQVVKGSADWATLVSDFEGNRNPWAPMGQPIVGKDFYDHLGDTVSMSADGNVIAIGSPESGDCRGYVKVFRYYPVMMTTRAIKRIRRSQSAQDLGQWLQIGQKIRGVNCHHLNAKGDIIVVSSWTDNVKVFHLQGKTWCQMGILSGSDMCGSSVSLAPNAHRIAVGPDENSGEYVYIYDYNGTDWVQVGKVAAHSSEHTCCKSVSLSSCGKQVAIGSIGYDDNENEHYECVKVYQCR